MRKFISFILALTVVLSLFAFPASAEETITDLQKVYTNLSTYLYTPYYQNSEYYDEYQKVMDEAGELLESDDITQAEISKYYTEIRQAYAKLMQDTYDYSSLEELLKAYDALDGSIFTEETWKKVLSIRDSAKKELDSPSLFSRTENMTEKQYAAYINNHIKTFTTDFNAAFNRLIFLPTPEEMTSEYLSGFIKLVRFCAREEPPAGKSFLTRSMKRTKLLRLPSQKKDSLIRLTIRFWRRILTYVTLLTIFLLLRKPLQSITF